MRTALCMYGQGGDMRGGYGPSLQNKPGPVNFKACFDSYKEKIIDVNNCDIFMHTWAVKHEKILRNLYQPKKAIFEPQKVFVKIQNKAIAARSRWYSTQQVLRLKKQYEEENNFKYDWVMLLRYDVIFFTEIDFSKFKPEYFYVSNMNMCPSRPITIEKTPKLFGRITHPDNITFDLKIIEDLWMFSNSNYMDIFSTLYDYLDEYGKAFNKAAYSPHTGMWFHLCKFIGNPHHGKVKYVFRK